MTGNRIIGIDLGGTRIRGAQVHDRQLSEVLSVQVPASGTADEVLQELYQLTDQLMTGPVQAIGIGVPGVVEVAEGIVYDVQNIPSWKEMPLKEKMERRYHVPVLVNNDANCFALGEKHFGTGRQAHSFIGLTIGTGLGAGIIIDDKLYAGPNCGAGEFGMAAYLDQYYEYYASGQFFKHCYHTTGEEVFQKAEEGDKTALKILAEFGMHLGNAVKMILYAHDPELIVLGGSIRQAYPYFQETMRQRINTFAYPRSLEKFELRISTLEFSGVLGAAALFYNDQTL